MVRICIFGDSIAYGAQDSEGGGWVDRLKRYYQSDDLQIAQDVNIYNLGVSADNTDDLLKRFEPELIARLADNNIIVFAIGINDSQFVISKGGNRVSQKDFRANLESLVQKSKQYTDKIVFIGLTKVDESKTVPIPWNTDKNYTNDDIQKYDSIIQLVVKETGVKYIGMGDVVELKDLSDGLHPTSNGHNKMFEVVKEKIGL